MSKNRSKAAETHRTHFEEDIDIRSGMRADPYTNKKGLYAEIDKANIKERAKQKLAAFGEGVTRWAMVDVNGRALPDSVYVNDNILFRPNQRGVFSSVHESFLKDQLRKEEEINNYVKKVIHYLVNDRTNALIFGLSDDEYTDIFGPSSAAKMAAIGLKMDEDVAKLNCKASYMQILLPESAAFHASSIKLWQLTKFFMPMIAMESETKENKEGEPGVSLNPFESENVTSAAKAKSTEN